MNGLFSKTIGMLSDLVGARSQRHQVLASNVSNIDTPGYEPKDVDFQNLVESMQGKAVRMARTNRKHLPASTSGEAGLSDAWTLAAERVNDGLGTFNDFGPARRDGVRIDWLPLRGWAGVRRAEIVTYAEDGRTPSDHFPVVVDLQIQGG